ncbi:MAG TPA: PEP-CTERM sorting domain-containing protein [Steroidobacteraceae bacterium]|nr:PEP-CTERM sorting domain-containing protein [Steroidobacteraceae bacterium]
MRVPRLAIQGFCVAFLYLSSLAVAQAAIIPFFGTRDSFGGTPPAPSPPLCPGAAFLAIPSGPGDSNLGAFTHDDSHCVAMGTVYDGVFNWDFDQGDTIFGTFSGFIQVANGLTTFDEDFVITGGSGRFVNASGSFNGIGVVTFTPSGANTHMDFEGSITLVPEPATLALLLLCLPWLLLRRRRVRVTKV